MNLLKKITKEFVVITVLFACMPQAKAMSDWSAWAVTGASVAAGACTVGGHKLWQLKKSNEIASYVRNHKTIELQSALEKDKNIAKGGSLGIKHISQAAFTRNLGGAIALLAYGADSNVNCREWLEGDGQTPLITAVQKREADMVAVLVAAGAQPKITDDVGWDAHAYAVGDMDHTIQNLLKDPIAARTHVMSKVLNRADLKLFPETVEKIILRMCDGKQLTSAVVKYSHQDQQGPLKKQLIKYEWLYRHFGEKPQRFLPHEVIRHIESFLDRDQFSVKELSELLKPVIATAHHRGDVQVKQRAQKFLANTYVDGRCEYDEKNDE